ncbi:response regulator [Bacillus sp. Marseille-Q3570]|uniref:response regulator n=1 Tax=Bacillus sp. Marseille-Q3570 TaxID=2963522 RepID=UPI0028DB74C8|nr:response regulator [Bacillus sp. Marseille-Q3570]
MSYTFLVVDDTSFMRKMAADCLKQYGHTVAGEAVNGKEAVHKYKAIQPQVVMMDLTMPEMNGIEAIKEILKVDAEAVILVCSASNQKDMIQEALDAGAVGYLMKPFKPDYMNEIIKKYAEPHLKSAEAEISEEAATAETSSRNTKETEKAESEIAAAVETVKDETDEVDTEAAARETVAQTEEEVTLLVDHKASPERVNEPNHEIAKPAPTRNSKIKFLTSYMCNWEEEVQGETKSFAFTYTENDQNVCLEMIDASNEKHSIRLSLDGFRDLYGWLEQRLEEGKNLR